MSVGFSTIRRLDPATISKKPTYSTNSQQTPVASSPIDNGQTKTKKSHWFLKTLIGVTVTAAALALGRKYLGNIFDPQLALPNGAKWHQKALHYTKKYIGVAGQFILDKSNAAIKFVKNLIPNKAQSTATGSATAGTTIAP